MLIPFRRLVIKNLHIIKVASLILIACQHAFIFLIETYIHRLPYSELSRLMHRRGNRVHLSRSFGPHDVGLLNKKYIQNDPQLTSDIRRVGAFALGVESSIVNHELSPQEIRPDLANEALRLGVEVLLVHRDHVIRGPVASSLLPGQQEVQSF